MRVRRKPEGSQLTKGQGYKMDDASGDADTDTDNFIYDISDNNSNDNMYGCARHNLWCENATGCAFLCIWEMEKRHWVR